MKERENRRWLVPAVLAVTLAFYLFVAWAVPWCVTDDLQWGMEQGFRWWRYGLLNGRYVGNFFALVMCHFPPVKVLIMGGGMFAIPFLLAALMCRGDRRKFLPVFMASNGAVMFMPGSMWSQVYGWISGFGNYALSTAAFLGFLLLVRRTHERRDRLKLRSLLLFLLALAMGLFVENESIFFVGVALVLGVYAAIWDKPLRLPYWSAFAGAVLAAAVLFSNGVAVELAQSGNAIGGLRELTFSWSDSPVQVLRGILKAYFFQRLPGSFQDGCQIAVLLGIISALGFGKSRYPALAALGAAPVILWCWLRGTGLYEARGGCYAICLCWSLPLLALAVQKREWKLKIRQMLLFLSAPLVLFPLAAATTTGPRFHFFPLVALIAVAADLAAPALSSRPGVWAAGVALAVTVGVWSARSITVSGCNHLRAQLIQQAADTGGKEILQPADRYYETFWFGRTAWNAEYAVYYRQFYGIPDDVTLVFLPTWTYEMWPDLTEDQWARRTEYPPYEGEFVSSLP